MVRARLLDDGLDEMAARTYQGLPVRLAVTVVAAGLAGLLLPWRICLIWLLTQGLSEALGVLVSRPQAKGVAGDLGLRTGHLVSVAVGCCIWMSLGGMLWISGAAAGAVCAVILWLSVVFFAHSNAYQSIGGFFVGGLDHLAAAGGGAGAGVVVVECVPYLMVRHDASRI